MSTNKTLAPVEVEPVEVEPLEGGATTTAKPAAGPAKPATDQWGYSLLSRKLVHFSKIFTQ